MHGNAQSNLFIVWNSFLISSVTGFPQKQSSLYWAFSESSLNFPQPLTMGKQAQWENNAL